ncbi:hypothetical protein EYF80_002076 [Liparis tanakae]|uniref:Uncharacterized protein n=1 Tax=Liparis tanakae TaxID=230148 RepID=A0A4Z2JBX7_9TELE|nr:hypothetical protein EYF80_002076 [Liparis tanakae]
MLSVALGGGSLGRTKVFHTADCEAGVQGSPKSSKQDGPGLKIRPSVASLLLRRMGGVWTPVTRQPVLSTLCWSINSTAGTQELEKKPREEYCMRPGCLPLASALKRMGRE